MCNLISIICLYTLSLHVLFKKNLTEISLRTYSLTLLIAALLISCIFILINCFVHNREYTFSILFFVYFILNLLSHDYNKKSKRTWACIFALCLGILLCLDILVFSKFKIFTLINSILKYSVFAVTFIVLADLIKSVITFNVNCSKNEENLQREFYNLLEGRKEGSVRPDIYHIILDSHSGFDDSRFDNSEFKMELLKRGFKIILGTKANYNFTKHSLPSILNFDYLENFIETPWHNLFKSYSHYFINRLHFVLASLGYECNILSHHHFKPIPKLSNTSIHYSYLSKNSMLALKNMVCFYLKNFIKFYYYDYVTDINEINSLYKFSKINISNRPTYNFLHFLAPHEPFLFDSQFNSVNKKYHNNLSYFEEYQKGINKKVIALIDEIQGKMKDNSIIIIHSDHGSPCFDKSRYKILLTVYDKSDVLKLNDNITLVNLFRIVLNNLFNLNLKYLDEKFYHYYFNTGDISPVDFKSEDFIKSENKDWFFV